MKSDVIFPLTRIIAGIVVLFLVAAFGILFFLPDQTGTLFAWAIKPHMSSMFFGSAYLGGAWILAQTAFGPRWHRVQAVFPAVTIFTTAMLAATLPHWERFSLGTIPFLAWLILYIVSPFLIPALWIYNRNTDSHEPEESDVTVPTTARLILRLFGGLVLLLVTICYLIPSLIIPIWPWELTPLTARVLCGWLSVIGTLSLVNSFDPRWTSWRASFEGIFIAYSLILVAATMNPAEFKTGIINWYTLFTAGMLIAIVIFYGIMESRRRKR
ncbi:MAG TPA: hypothetical protein PLT08_00600 [Anaerolineales bacterium]|nr:hypothetical protein [Anaerolineales bacterium]